MVSFVALSEKCFYRHCTTVNIHNFQWQSENLGHANLTHLGWSVKVPHFLSPFDPKEGQMQKKNCRYSDWSIEKQAPWFRLGSNVVPPIPFQFLQKCYPFYFMFQTSQRRHLRIHKAILGWTVYRQFPGIYWDKQLSGKTLFVLLRSSGLLFI